jgi:hypothetical protein
MWNVKTTAIPVVIAIGETGTISEPFRQYLRNIQESTKSGS